MGIKRYKPEEIVTKLRQVEVLAGQGMASEAFWIKPTITLQIIQIAFMRAYKSKNILIMLGPNYQKHYTLNFLPIIIKVLHSYYLGIMGM